MNEIQALTIEWNAHPIKRRHLVENLRVIGANGCESKPAKPIFVGDADPLATKSTRGRFRKSLQKGILVDLIHGVSRVLSTTTSVELGLFQPQYQSISHQSRMKQYEAPACQISQSSLRALRTRSGAQCARL